MLIPEGEYKNKLIGSLNSRTAGWIDGDQETLPGKKADVVNYNLKIAIEIKDDLKSNRSIPRTEQLSDSSEDCKSKNRQFKDDMKNASDKFKSYPDYKTILLLRADVSPGLVKYCSDGLLNLDTFGNCERLSSYYMEHDYSTSEVGCVLQITKFGYSYFENRNPNVSGARKISKADLESILGIKIDN